MVLKCVHFVWIRSSLCLLFALVDSFGMLLHVVLDSVIHLMFVLVYWSDLFEGSAQSYAVCTF